MEGGACGPECYRAHGIWMGVTKFSSMLRLLYSEQKRINEPMDLGPIRGIIMD